MASTIDNYDPHSEATSGFTVELSLMFREYAAKHRVITTDRAVGLMVFLTALYDLYDELPEEIIVPGGMAYKFIVMTRPDGITLKCYDF